MTRCIFYLKDSTPDYVNIKADEFHEDGDFIKAYDHNELVFMTRIENIKTAYRTEQRS